MILPRSHFVNDKNDSFESTSVIWTIQVGIKDNRKDM